MPFNFHIGLPGPFSYSRRLGRRRARRAQQGPGEVTRAVGAGLDRAAGRIDAWGEEGLRRSRERRVAQGLSPDPEVKSFREIAMPEGSFAEMVASRKRRLGRR